MIETTQADGGVVLNGNAKELGVAIYRLLAGEGVEFKEVRV